MQRKFCRHCSLFPACRISPADRQTQIRRLKQQGADIFVAEDSRFKIVKLHKRIFFPSLLEELQRRRISPAVADLYLKQVFLSDANFPERKLNGFAFANHKSGYEISIPNIVTGRSFKTSTRPKTYTLIAGQDKSQALIFEGFWDFLSYLEMRKIKVPECDIYVLNSVSFWHDVALDIIGKKEMLKHVALYMDNDKAGDDATNNFSLELGQSGLTVVCRRHEYIGFKDLNDWLTN